VGLLRKQNGIFAGSAQLRHATIQMTASHYTDPRQRAALPVGKLFSDGCKKSSRRRQLKPQSASEQLRVNGHGS
jgi:hypothetical protein